MKTCTGMFWLVTFSLVFALAAGCAKKPAPSETMEQPVETQVQDQQVSSVTGSGVAGSEMSDQAVMDKEMQAAAAALQRIHFEFDQFVLSEEARQALAANADYLRSHPVVKVKIEGHCDERGSDEYNLALGERRAQAARDYLVSLGLGGGRLSTISYGEEVPLDPAANETAWAKNRRADFKPVR